MNKLANGVFYPDQQYQYMSHSGPFLVGLLTRWGVSNHGPLDCLFNSLFRLTTKQIQKNPNYSSIGRRIHPSLVVSLHKWGGNTESVSRSWRYPIGIHITLADNQVPCLRDCQHHLLSLSDGLKLDVVCISGFIKETNPIKLNRHCHYDGYWTHYDLVTQYGNIHRSYGLLPDGTKPLPEPMLTYDQ